MLMSAHWELIIVPRTAETQTALSFATVVQAMSWTLMDTHAMVIGQVKQAPH